jgi:hypothetical protein
VDERFADRVAGFDVVGETRRFIYALAERHALRVQWVEDANYDLYCEIAPQRGLALDLWFSLSENSVRFGQRDWAANFHHIERVTTWNEARRAFEGLITGQARVALSYSPGRRRPFFTSVELLERGDWRGVSSGIGLAVPPVFRTVYRYNGQEEAGPKGIARGSFVTLAAVAASLWWLFA